MKATRGTLKSLRGPVLLAAMAGLAVSASGCVIDSSTSPPACSPDLFINWRIVENVSNAILTCDQVPASTIEVNVSGSVTDFACPGGASQGQIPITNLSVTGTYTVMVTLLDSGGNVLSSTGNNPIAVDCSGQTQTPLIDLVVN